uniref:Uncharacterized protein n=1 Tax=Meteorus pulchricornis TaxID=51522 RepID=H7CHJ3_9HYME|nr:hypothetical protein [Meteorus pulchricornis]
MGTVTITSIILLAFTFMSLMVNANPITGSLTETAVKAKRESSLLDEKTPELTDSAIRPPTVPKDIINGDVQSEHVIKKRLSFHGLFSSSEADGDDDASSASSASASAEK